MGSANLTRRVRDLTGLTVPALARKLRVDRDQIRRWEADGKEPPEPALTILKQLLTGSQAAPTPNHSIPPGLPTGVVQADGVAYLKQLPDDSVEMILSDIPYGIGLGDWDVLHDNKNSAYMGASEAQRQAGKVFSRRHKPINGWSSEDRQIPQQYYEWCSRWTSEWLRVLRPGGSAVVFAGRRLAPRCATAMEDAGFCLRDMLSWVRPHAVLRAQRLSLVYKKRGDLHQALRYEGWRVGNLRPSFEPILWCFKPYAQTLADNMLEHGVGAFNMERYQASSGRDDNVIEAAFRSGERGYHEAQKPVALLRSLIELCTQPGQLVLDPFAGSGSTGVAAQSLGRRCLMIELDAELCKTAKMRLQEG